jgi:hypothetical protein
MATPSRDEAIETLQAGDRELQQLFARLDERQMNEPKTIGGGEWSAKDLLGHIAFWEELAVEALEALRSGAKPSVEAIFASGTDGVDEINAANQERTTAEAVGEVRERAAKAHSAIVGSIREMSEEEWRARVPYPTERRETTALLLASILGAPKRAFGHAFAHLPDLLAYVTACG